jgi:hypothetical protein
MKIKKIRYRISRDSVALPFSFPSSFFVMNSLFPSAPSPLFTIILSKMSPLAFPYMDKMRAYRAEACACAVEWAGFYPFKKHF